MFRYILKKIKYSSLKNKNKSMTSDRSYNEPILPDLKRNLENIRNIMSNSSDVTIHEFNFGKDRRFRGALIFIDNLVFKEEIHQNILKPLMYDTLKLAKDGDMDFTDIDNIRMNVVSTTDNEKVEKLCDILDNLLEGSTILLVDGSKEALVINMKKYNTRDVEEPGTETVVRGPREGFTENARTNIALVRRKIKDLDLCIEKFKIGDKTKTDVYIAYLKSIANPDLVEEVRTRLKRIKADAILESGYIEQFIEDAPYSIFSTVSNCEKPDKAAAKILEGRVSIFVDGTPFVLGVPMLFVESFQSGEDYYTRHFLASTIRIIRFLAYGINILAPASYVALTVFHQEVIPTQLLISIAAGRAKVPFPALLEALLMILTFDILREAGIRLPKHVGQTISIVGALVLGQTAVDAGLISPLMVIVVAATAIASFVVPSQVDSGTILRYFYLLLAGVAGGFGVIMGIMITLLHLSSLRSFGIPYLWPVAPLDYYRLSDTFIRMPLRSIMRNERGLPWNDSESSGLIPSPNKRNSKDTRWQERNSNER